MCPERLRTSPNFYRNRRHNPSDTQLAAEAQQQLLDRNRPQLQQEVPGQEGFRIRGRAQQDNTDTAQLQIGFSLGQGTHGPTGDPRSHPGLVNLDTGELSSDYLNSNYHGEPGRAREREEHGGNGSRGARGRGGSGSHQQHRRRNDNNDRGPTRGRVVKPYQGGRRDRRPRGGGPA